MLLQVGLCQTWSEATLLVFPRGGSFIDHHLGQKMLEYYGINIHIYMCIATGWGQMNPSGPIFQNHKHQVQLDVACMDPRGTIKRTFIHCYIQNMKAL